MRGGGGAWGRAVGTRSKRTFRTPELRRGAAGGAQAKARERGKGNGDEGDDPQRAARAQQVKGAISRRDSETDLI